MGPPDGCLMAAAVLWTGHGQGALLALSVREGGVSASVALLPW